MRTNVWVTRPEKLCIVASEKKPDRLIDFVQFGNQDMSSCGWVKVGTAEVEITLDSSGSIEAGAISAIDAKIEEVREESVRRIKELQDAKQSLLALTMRVSA